AMIYRNRKNACSFLLGGMILFALGYFAQWDEPNPDEPEGGTGLVILGVIACLIAINAFISGIEINTEGLRRRTWFGLVKHGFAWTSLLSWKVAQVPQHVEESAGTWFVEFELAGVEGTSWMWVNESQVEFVKF